MILSYRPHMLLSSFIFSSVFLSAVLIGWFPLFYLPDHLFLLLWKVKVKITQSCTTLCNPKDYTFHDAKAETSPLTTSCEELTHWKRLWCWEGLGAGGEGDDRGWDGWMASLTRWTWVSVNSGSWWWTGRPGVLRFMRSQRVGHNSVTELNWMIHSMEFPRPE